MSNIRPDRPEVLDKSDCPRPRFCPDHWYRWWKRAGAERARVDELKERLRERQRERERPGGGPARPETGTVTGTVTRDPAPLGSRVRRASRGGGEKGGGSKTAALTAAERLAEQGRRLWAELHRRSLAYVGGTPEAEAAEREWLAAWAGRLPKAGCNCRDEWARVVGEMPPDLGGASEFFAWSVAVHNAINKHLRKPELTVEEARLFWEADPAVSPGP